MTRVLVTGSGGYVGGRLARHWLGHPEVELRLGSHSSDTRPVQHSSAEIVRLDVTNDQDVEAACDGVHAVVHLAAANAAASSDPEHALFVNGMGSLKLLRAAERAGVERFVYFSTAHVYGSPLVGSISEKTTPRPASPYAISHRVAEDFVLAAHDAGRLLGIVVRLSNAVGPPAHPAANCWTLLANDLCRQAVVTRTLQLRTRGDQLRDFVPMSDVLKATAHLIGLPREAIGDGLFNVGGNCSVSTYEMARRIASRCEGTLGFLPPILRPASPGARCEADHLDYGVRKLESTGLSLSGLLDDEIDATLTFANHVFG